MNLHLKIIAGLSKISKLLLVNQSKIEIDIMTLQDKLTGKMMKQKQKLNILTN